MAADENTTDVKTAAAETISKTKTKSSVVESKFKKEIFLNNAKALGYEKYIVVGAFSSVQKDELTKSEFREIMDNFLGKKVK
ncbi:MAG: hypothetical protein KIC94_18850 [Clostridiales bacterium]|nr:hypothetical protein [Clostridiales bacterium]